MLKEGKIPETFAKGVTRRINAQLNTLEMPVKELAARANVSYSTALAWSNGDRLPGSWQLYKLAKALGTSADYLIGLK